MKNTGFTEARIIGVLRQAAGGLLVDLPGESGAHQLKNQEVAYGQREQTDAGVRREAVRLALTSGRMRREIAEDLGIGLSTLT